VIIKEENGGACILEFIFDSFSKNFISNIREKNVGFLD